MKKYTRLLAGLLALALLLSIAPLTVLAEDTPTDPSTETTTATTEPPADSTETTAATTEPPATTEPAKQTTPTNPASAVNLDEGEDEEGDEGEGAGEPAPIAVNSGVTTILVPLSADNQETTYAVAINNPQGEPSISPEDNQYINVWKAAAGTYDCVYVVGHKLGTAKFQLDGKTYTVRVVPQNPSYSTSRSIKVSASGFDTVHAKMYYSINGGELYEAQADEVDIDQTFPGGFNIMIFAAPADGYALTKLIANQGIEQYYSLAGELEDGSDSNAWPFTDPNANDLTYSFKKDPVNGSEKHGFSALLEQKSMTVDGMRDLFTRAKKLGCDGVLTYTRNAGNQGLDVTVSCEVVPLPTMTKTIVGYKPKNKTENTDSWISTIPNQLEIGDQLKYAFTVTGSGSQNIEFSNIVLEDELIGFSNDGYTSANLQSGDGFVAYAEYTIKTEDIAKYTGGKFTNSATLHYTYASKFSKGTKNVSQSSSVSCNIKNLITFDWCEHTPDAIKNDKRNFPVPNGFEVQVGSKFTLPSPKTTKYDVFENGYVVGTWNFMGYGYLRSDNTHENYIANEELEITDADINAVFHGHWEYTEAHKYSVTLEWKGLPEYANVDTPTHSEQYYAGQSFNVDSFFEKGMITDVNDVYYIFAGWKLTETDSATVSGLQKMTEGGITLYGEWNPLGKQTNLTISVSGCNAVDKNQTYLFRVTGDDVDLTVALHGNESVTINGVLSNQSYTVTPISDWSWRYKYLDSQTIAIEDDGSTVTFQQERTSSKWLDGNAFRNPSNNSKGDG